VGGADREKSDGTSVFFARMGTRELAETWKTGMEEKAQDPLLLAWEKHDTAAAGCPVLAVVCQDEDGWYAEAVVDLGRDRGTDDLPMYAVYLTCHGPSRDAVWTDGIKVFLNTLRLG
jgi:hypothetical protein